MERPDLWGEILEHPNAQPELWQWIAKQHAAEQPTPDDPPEAPLPGRLSKRATAVVAVVIAVLLAVGGAAASLAATGALDRWFGEPEPAPWSDLDA
ncbi:hypothetical protein J4H92_03900 [Leucobacter weissii]|uniref:Leucine rich repeat variant domain-containing protein n=1 Tax=Leucobacter weissii TaxID=1983706 RepID=A0A939S7K7_9MICO|nr:hypothetical protein [Leucobacter weissii]MBO1901091.1 hypothetical protein [Leucobacter weissii]